MRLKAQAKINLGIWVHGKREDGYHAISTLFLPLDLSDEIELKEAEEFSIEGPNFASDDFIFKAKERLEKVALRKLPVSVKIRKNIPVGAGLAGGTADGAAVLHGINHLYKLGYSLADLQAIARPLGADFAYCLLNQASIGQGMGDELDLVPSFPDAYGLLLNPGYSLGTREVYKKVRVYSPQVDFSPILSSLREGDYSSLRRLVENDLEKGLLGAYPEIQRMKDDLYRLGAGLSLMSGSGPSVYGIFPSKEERDQALEAVEGKYPLSMGVRIIGGRKDG